LGAADDETALQGLITVQISIVTLVRPFGSLGTTVRKIAMIATVCGL
jgi:hypothetical protein